MKSRTIVVALAVLSAIFLIAGFFEYRTTFPFAPAAAMSITHTVLFQFKADAKSEDVKAATARFLDLKTNCLHPTTNSAYILSLKGGKDNSPEGLQNGITHGFVAEFNSAQDRDYYVKTDPAHQAFIKSLDGLVEKAIVVDFSDGVY